MMTRIQARRLLLSSTTRVPTHLPATHLMTQREASEGIELRLLDAVSVGQVVHVGRRAWRVARTSEDGRTATLYPVQSAADFIVAPV